MGETESGGATSGMQVGQRKVHLVSVGFEVARIVEPIVSIGADEVVVFRSWKEARHFEDFISEVKEQLRQRVKPLLIRDCRTDLFDFQKLVAAAGKEISSETAAGNHVLVNISTGSRQFDAAALVAAMMFGASPYYVPVEGYLLPPRAFYRSGRPVGTVTKVRQPVPVHRFDLPPPAADLVRCLSVIAGLEQKGVTVKQTGLVHLLQQSNLLSVKRGEAPKELARGLSECRHKYVDPLLSRKWISIEGRRRNARLRMTELGRSMLTMFGPVFVIVPDV